MDIEEFTSKFCRIACRQFVSPQQHEKALTSLVVLLGICVSLTAVLPTFKRDSTRPIGVAIHEVTATKSQAQHWTASLTYDKNNELPVLDVGVFMTLVLSCVTFSIISLVHNRYKNRMQACAYHAAMELAHTSASSKVAEASEEAVIKKLTDSAFWARMVKSMPPTRCNCETEILQRTLVALTMQYLRDQGPTKQHITESRPMRPESLESSQ